MQLNDHQKRAIIDYMLCGVSKGLYEDCEEFWVNPDGTPMTIAEVDTWDCREAVDVFVEEMRETLHMILDTGRI